MRKILLLACAIFCGAIANAQLVTSRSSIETKEKKVKKTTWMIKAGIATNNVVGDYVVDAVDAKVGYNVGFEFNRAMGNKGAYWGMDFLFGSRGYKYGEDYGEYEYEGRLTAHNFQWSPFTFGWKIDITDKIAIDPHIGAFFSIDYAGTATEKASAFGETEKYSEPFSPFDNFDCPVDVGMKLGVGVWFNKKFNFDITFQRGFVPFINEVCSSNFLFRLGYAF